MKSRARDAAIDGLWQTLMLAGALEEADARRAAQLRGADVLRDAGRRLGAVNQEMPSAAQRQRVMEEADEVWREHGFPSLFLASGR